MKKVWDVKHRQLLRRLWSLTMALCCVYTVRAGDDTIRVIDEVTVRSKIRYHETIAPQTLNAQTIEQLSAHTVADALRWMSGVQLKDYGGIGGLKTVNLRSMGSQHVGIYYDGVALGNAQNGVIDLGQFALDNVAEIDLYHGQRSAIMQTAQDFANAGNIYIKTLNPLNETRRGNSTKIRLQAGSSTTLRISALHQHRVNERLAWNLNAEALSSTGKYTFRYQRRNLDGTMAYDTTAVRQNGDIQQLRAETNLYGLTNGGNWQLKAYTFAANRGIPGAIVNNVWRRGERQKDWNTMLQGTWQQELNERYTAKATAKYAYYRTHYINKDSTLMLIDDTYRQHEAYASLVQVAELTPWCSASLSYDLRWNHLDANKHYAAQPDRWTHMVSIALAVDLDRWQMQTSGVLCCVNDRPSTGGEARHIREMAPALFLSYRAAEHVLLTGFAKRSFRMPTLNDLYYTEIGNAQLKPEMANQYSLGVRLTELQIAGGKGSINLEAYHNAVHDKIIAYPKGQQFRWTMLNLGRVHIDGIELRADHHWLLGRELRLGTMLQMTYQEARDVTDATASYYGDQIPYTPWISGSATVTAAYRCWSLGYNFVYTGERYSQPENIAYNHLQPWYTSDVTVSWHLGRWRATLEVRNLLDQQYDVIINYPMPGRNYNLTLQCTL